MLAEADVADPGQAHPADDRVVAAFCRLKGCAVVVRQSEGWTIIGSPPGVAFPVVFVDYVPGHFSALDLPANERARATAAVLRWPAAVNFGVFELARVDTPGERQMCFWYAAARGLSRWEGVVLPVGTAWTTAAMALKREVHTALAGTAPPPNQVLRF